MKRQITVILVVSVGMLLTVATDGAADTCTVPSLFFSTIQSAINNAACSTIKVAPGAYTEQLTIERSLDLRGAGAELTVIQAPALLDDPKAIIHISGAATKATVEEFTLQGPGSSGCDSLHFGVFVAGGATATIRDNRLLAIRDEPLSGCQNGVAVLVGRDLTSQVGHATVSKNYIEDYQKGAIVVDGAGSTATIEKNIVQGGGFRCCGLAAQNGIQVSRGAVAEVVKNKVFDNMYDPEVAGSGGILLFEAGNEVEVSRNTADANDVGVWVVATNLATIERNTAMNSTFDGVLLDNQNLTAGVTTDHNLVRRNRLSGNGNGVGLFSAHSNVIEKNRALGSFTSGFIVSAECDYQVDFSCTALQASSSSNVFLKNTSVNNAEVGYFDDSLGGGTAGTANTYIDNRCKNNTEGDSSPVGLCGVSGAALSGGPMKVAPPASVRRSVQPF